MNGCWSCGEEPWQKDYEKQLWKLIDNPDHHPHQTTHLNATAAPMSRNAQNTCCSTPFHWFTSDKTKIRTASNPPYTQQPWHKTAISFTVFWHFGLQPLLWKLTWVIASFDKQWISIFSHTFLGTWWFFVGHSGGLIWLCTFECFVFEMKDEKRTQTFWKFDWNNGLRLGHNCKWCTVGNSNPCNSSELNFELWAWHESHL